MLITIEKAKLSGVNCRAEKLDYQYQTSIEQNPPQMLKNNCEIRRFSAEKVLFLTLNELKLDSCFHVSIAPY